MSEQCPQCFMPKLQGCGTQARGVFSDVRSGFLVRHLICPNLKEFEAESPIPSVAVVSGSETEAASQSQKQATSETQTTDPANCPAQP
jgi:hypothetical protein